MRYLTLVLIGFNLLFSEETSWRDSLFIQASAAQHNHQYLVDDARNEIIEKQEEFLPFLVTKFTTQQPREYHALRYLFTKIDGELAMKHIAPLLAEKDRESFYMGCYYLSRTGYSGASDLFKSYLDDDSTYVVMSGVKALGEIKDSTAVSNLEKLIETDNINLQWSVTASLGKIGTSESAKVLNRLLNDDRQLVSHTAFKYLQNMSKKDSTILDCIDSDSYFGKVLKGVDIDDPFGKHYGGVK